MTIKKDRELIFNKYGGRCAYCGCNLKKGWHVDHIEAHWHNFTDEQSKKHGIIKGSHALENKNPSCPRCNRWKATFTIEQFRREIQFQCVRLQGASSNYRMARDYGLIQETGIKVKFYFEL